MRPVPSRKLDRRITRVWRLSAAFNVILWSALAFIPLVFIVWVLRQSNSSDANFAANILGFLSLAVLVLFVVFAIVFVVIMPKIRWIQWSFDIYDEEIDLHHGIFWKRRVIIPLIRVQNVDTRQGPLMRMMGLSAFTVATAAGEHVIPGLDVEEADALRDRVALLARIAQEDV